MSILILCRHLALIRYAYLPPAESQGLSFRVVHSKPNIYSESTADDTSVGLPHVEQARPGIVVTSGTLRSSGLGFGFGFGLFFIMMLVIGEAILGCGAVRGFVFHRCVSLWN
jgi:hypothetical protein